MRWGTHHFHIPPEKKIGVALSTGPPRALHATWVAPPDYNDHVSYFIVTT